MLENGTPADLVEKKVYDHIIMRAGQQVAWICPTNRASPAKLNT